MSVIEANDRDRKPRTRPRIADRWAAFRARMIADPRFQRFAATFPLTRPIANRKARELFDLTAGFVYSQILFACVQCDLFRHLSQQDRTADDIAATFGLPPASARRLLDGAAALGLLRRTPAGYGLGDLGAAMLANPGIGAMVEHHATLYADLADPLRLLRDPAADTRLSRYWQYAGNRDPSAHDPAIAADYSRLMAVSQAMVSSEVLASFSFARYRSLLDVGGGEGAFLTAVGTAYPHLSLNLFDLPAVAPIAKRRFQQAGLGGRSHIHAGSFFEDPLPEVADIITLVRVLYDHDDAAALHILKAARAALKPNGTLLIAEPMARTPGSEAMGDAYFGFYLLAMKGGRPRSAAELSAFARSAGFRATRRLKPRSPLMTGLIVAYN